MVKSPALNLSKNSSSSLAKIGTKSALRSAKISANIDSSGLAWPLIIHDFLGFLSWRQGRKSHSQGGTVLGTFGSMLACCALSFPNDLSGERKVLIFLRVRSFGMHALYHFYTNFVRWRLGHVTLWHKIIAKIFPWEIFFTIFEGLCTLEIAGQDIHFHRITREICNCWKNYFRIIFRK